MRHNHPLKRAYRFAANFIFYRLGGKELLGDSVIVGCGCVVILLAAAVVMAIIAQLWFYARLVF
jgi:hypothetical protein